MTDDLVNKARACAAMGTLSRGLVRELVAALEAERAENARLRHAIAEASDPDFLWGAMDNVTDMDTTLDDYAKAASRAIRAAVQMEGQAND